MAFTSESRRSPTKGDVMLIGRSTKRPKLETVRRIKNALRTVLDLPEDAIITVTQLACLEQGCAPLETVVGLLRSGEPQLQYKFHKETDAIDSIDLVRVSVAWGFETQSAAFEPFFN